MPRSSISSLDSFDRNDVIHDSTSFISDSQSENDEDQITKSTSIDTNGHLLHRPILTDLTTLQTPSENEEENIKPLKEEPATWSSLPQKSQLAVLTLARLSEPLAERSLAAYMYYQLRWFDPELPESTITSQGGVIIAAFAAAQFVTAVWWGRAADSPWIGRKRVILIGLFGTFVSCIGIGFSKSYYQALAFRLMSGALNGNVGVMRTMISEIIKEKKFQSRAFLLLPMCFNIGVIIGPILGGFLADPIPSFPRVFGPGSLIGGEKGVQWMISFPFALPNMISGALILLSAFGIIFFLDETHEALKYKPDYGRKIGKLLTKFFLARHRQGYQYTQLNEHQLDDDNAIDLEEHPRSHSNHNTSSPTNPPPLPPVPQPKPTILTKNVIITLLTNHLLALHASTFNALVFLYLPFPISTPSQTAQIHLPFSFTGGLGLATSRVGLATAIIGLIGFPLQILLYPTLNAKLGTLRAYRTFLPFSIVAYLFLPYLSLLPAYGFTGWIWPALTLLLAVQVLSRTFAIPGSVILVNNCAPARSVLGTVHGISQSVSSGGRTAGPLVGGWVLGWGMKRNCVGLVWWGMAGVAAANWALLWTIFEGDGAGGVSAS